MSTEGTTIARQTCLHHPRREAVARCPECGRFFCRECITEHDFRMICAGCLATLREASRGGEVAAPKIARRWWSGLRRTVAPVLQLGAAFVLAWWIFLTFGRVLIEVPTELHEGVLLEKLMERAAGP